MGDWHFLVDRDDYRHTEIVDAEPADLEDGQIRVRVDAFGLTANNVTYAAAGDLIGYWSFFPPPDTGDGTNWGRVPVWGFGEVVESRTNLVIGGDRLFGYFPMSTELVITPTRVTDEALFDGAEHRAALPPVYNRYVREGPGAGDATAEAEQMIYFPLFFTSFIIDDLLEDHDDFGADWVVLASASSKTAFGTAHQLHARGRQVVGLTSPGNVAFVEGLGCYDRVLTYDDVDELPAGRAVLVDMSGNRSVVRAVHERYGDDLAYSLAVGLTHWDEWGRSDAADELPGPAPTFFFAPDRMRKRQEDWGPDGFNARMAEAWGPFMERASGRVSIEHGSGPEAVAAVFAEAVRGDVRPDVAHVLHP